MRGRKSRARRARGGPEPPPCLLRAQLGAHALAAHLHAGKGAIEGRHREQFIERGGRITGSLNFDDAMRLDAPNDPRWDYILGIARSDERSVEAVEVHRATAGEVDVDTVIAKTIWSQRKLENAGVRVRLWHWLATSACPSFPSTSSAARRLASAGIALPKRTFVA